MPKRLVTGCFLTVLLFSCLRQPCVRGCSPVVKATRNDLYHAEGGSISLFCDVVHCERKWSGGWGITHKDFTFLTPSARVHLTNATFPNNTTRLYLNIYNLNQSDSGAYKCNIRWEGSDSQGHVTHLNVTSAQYMPEPEERKLYYRLMVCAAAGLCFSLTLTLVCCFICNRQSAPPVPPPRSQSNCKTFYLHLIIFSYYQSVQTITVHVLVNVLVLS
ncbi:hypothetical protein C0J50_14377 [Silurus asotus]|uniref:Ig-like domain-containing protein n=1 Tax=Silurus asotus TaxID=30991 RepID=A0AAD5B250_SILAS|nr:hypothetical protein C0J50_14377 [Silurus asotus]